MDIEQITLATGVTPAYLTINYVLNSFSILSSLLLTTTIITLKAKQIKFSDRISIRLILYISIFEIFFSISQMFRFDTHKFSLWVSYVSSWGYVFVTLTICSLIMSILINIQLTITYNYEDIIHLKHYYLVISISIATILSVLPIAFGKFNFDQERNYFWHDTAIWEWTTYTGWIAFFILYCAISGIHMFYRLRGDSRIISYNLTVNAAAPSSTVPHSISDRSKLISKYISRITLYSLILVVSYLPLVISNLTHYYTNEYYFTSLDLFSSILMSSQSIFIFIIFLLDPVVDEVILERKRKLEHKQQVLDNIQKGVYINNIELELPSNRDQKSQQQNNNDNRSYSRSTIYSYAMNAKSRISVLTSALYNRKKNVDVKKNAIGFDDEEDDIILLL